MASPSSIEIRLLGKPALMVGGEPIGLRTAQITVLLGYLATQGRRVVSRAAVAEALWPDRDPELAGQNLRQTLARLRQSAGAVADELLTVGRSELRLHPEAAETDVARFRAALAEGGAEGCRRAIAAYGGPFLEGFEADWIRPVRADLARLHLQAHLDLADRLMEHDPAEALSVARRAIELEPYHEGARAREIRALRAAGEEALALRAFETYEALLADELGLRPSRVVEQALGEAEEPSLPPMPADSGESFAIRTLIESGHPADALRLVVSLVPFWIETGAYGAGLRWLETLHDESPGDAGLAGQAALAVAMLSFRRGEIDRGMREAARALALATDDGARAEALAIVARGHLFRRENAEVRSSALACLRLARRLPGNLANAYHAWNSLFWAYQYEGESRRARQAAKRAMAASQTVRDRARSTLNLAFACADLGERAEARAFLQSVVETLAGDESRMSVGIRMDAARLFEEFGEVAKAEAGYRATVEAHRDTGDRWSLPIALTYLGDLRTAQGDPDAAIPLHTEALAIRNETDDRLGAATSLRGLGRALWMRGEPLAARSALRESVRLFAEVDALPGVASALIPLARCEAAVGSPAIARRLAERAVRLLRDMSPSVRATIGPESERLLPEAQALADELSN